MPGRQRFPPLSETHPLLLSRGITRRELTALSVVKAFAVIVIDNAQAWLEAGLVDSIMIARPLLTGAFFTSFKIGAMSFR
jgi:hypothetical protein